MFRPELVRGEDIIAILDHGAFWKILYAVAAHFPFDSRSSREKPSGIRSQRLSIFAADVVPSGGEVRSPDAIVNRN